MEYCGYQSEALAGIHLSDLDLHRAGVWRNSNGVGWLDNFWEIPENHDASWIMSYVDTLGSFINSGDL